MRRVAAASLLLVLFACAETASAAECPPGAMGVSRTIVVDPTEHTRLGGLQYRESLPLRDKEVVLTFDDGPLPPYTNRILETLASECVKATFFMVGRMVRGYPSIVRRVYNEGHTVANHSQNHPFTFAQDDGRPGLGRDRGRLRVAAHRAGRSQGDRSVLPHPGLAAAELGRAISRRPRCHDLERRRRCGRLDPHQGSGSRTPGHQPPGSHRKGILLLHDIQPATVLALPEILHELKARGFKIVHVVPATPDRPKTVTTPDQWAARTTPEQKVWPRLVPTTVSAISTAQPAFEVPSAASLGLSDPLRPVTSIALVPSVERPLVREGEVPLPPVLLWPRWTYATPVEAGMLPVPAAQTFRYSRVFQMPGSEKKKVASAHSPKTKSTTVAKPKDINTPASAEPAPSSTPSRPTGHQWTVVRPPMALSLPKFMR